MIYTITLNPALDRTLLIEKIKPDDSNRIEREDRYAGGKGIDVSRVLITLGIDNKAMGFIGGFSGEELEGRLLNDGISSDFVRISGETRTNIILNDLSTGGQSVFSARGPEVQPFELMQLIHKLEKINNCEVMIISGSLPPGIHAEVYRRIIEIAKEKGAKTVLDADGEALQIGVAACPDIIKPNRHELGRLIGRKLGSQQDILEAATKILKAGIPEVLVSMGALGILHVSAAGRYLATPPQIKVQNTIGAGDSAVAGYVYGILSGKTIKDSLITSVAAGTATTMRPGTALCRKEDIFELIPKVTFTEL
jgi:6-phosphofructokinase 2